MAAMRIFLPVGAGSWVRLGAAYWKIISGRQPISLAIVIGGVEGLAHRIGIDPWLDEIKNGAGEMQTTTTPDPIPYF